MASKPAKPRSQQIVERKAREVVALVEDALLEGFRPPDMPGRGKSAVKRAIDVAVASGIVNTAGAFYDRMSRAKGVGIIPDWTKYRQPQEIVKYVTHMQSDVRKDPPSTAYEPGQEPKRVLVIGDAHADPRQTLRRFTWIGRLAAERKADHILQIGDFGSWDSVSSHEVRGSVGYAARPTVDDDFDAMNEALRLINKEMPRGYKPIMDCTYGNHEDRIKRFENVNPELGQHLSLRLDETFARWGWRTREFGAHRYINGVGFTHAPLNTMSRPYGGKTGSLRAGNDSLVTLVHGHDHLRSIATVPKIGGLGKVDVISVGCALEWGWTEPYAKHGPNGWWWGCCEMTLAAGQVMSIDWIDMWSMRQRYSDDGADVAA